MQRFNKLKPSSNMKSLLFSAFIFLSICTMAQIQKPTKFTYQVTNLKKNSYQVAIQINLEGQWHIYAQKAGEGPVATKIVFDTNPLLTLSGDVIEKGNLLEKFDKSFNTTLRFYEKEVRFLQKINKKANIKTELKGYVYYMVCDDSKCLPPKKEMFTISIP